MVKQGDRKPDVLLGIDGHVLTGKFQGTRTTLGSLLKAVAPKLGGRHAIVYSDNCDEARALLGTDAFTYGDLGHAGSLKRLLSVIPRLFRRDGITLGVFQYMMPLGGRHIVFIHDLLPITHGRYFPLKVRIRTHIFFSRSIRKAAVVVAVSHYTRDEIARLYRVPQQRLRVVRNGPSFDPQVYGEAAEPGQDKYILAVGRIEERKNIKMLVEAFEKARPSGVRLIVVGSQDLGYDFSLPDDPAIEHRKGIDDEALIALYRGASLFAYPSAAEGFGMPLLDALLFGLPVISSNKTSLPEVAGPHAVYFDCDAPDATNVLAELIKGHFGDRPIAGPSPEGRAELARTFNWDTAANEFLAAVDFAAAAG